MFTITILPNSYTLVYAKSKKICIDPILRILYSNDFAETDELVDFHFSQTEVSMIIPIRFLPLFKDFSHIDEHTAIRVDTDNPGLEEPGIIASLTSVIKDYGITILATSTFMCNYIFIPTKEIPIFNKMVSEQQIFRLD